jgi:hypothetical protein
VKERVEEETKRLRKVIRVRGRPRLFHVSSRAEAKRILAHGFKERWQPYTPYRGAIFSNRPLDTRSGPTGDTLLRVTFKVKLRQLAQFELRQEGLPYREWVIPAAFVEQHAVIERGP